ncbi:ferritin-like domain-containing protein [Planktothrix sp. FACHB-1355]|uniref:Ferritin-like domain-containing protein n=1 Tax=Aerosakkonema funiforme FACHB-1375 TaxID=2949571 RepID=A0A926VJX3_9CYAN|nr:MULTISPECIES: ferritin-like domain-containing protein [Oscillatoriales]MBD2185104.1 ferritin-like domain-containing protein [Aerosakkonema funiforme FACHB-1375]MBD3561426.1 ferritin-like domain-containing protein [Planktothrix sp. FACHB-1355]
MKIGSEAHKQLFCQSFMESHLKYEPEQLPWPKLDGAQLERLRSIPFWDEAFDTEQNAGKMLAAFAETVSDPLLRDAIALQGMEESRHSRVIEFLINHYGIEIKPRPPKQIPDNVEEAFVKFGYGECFDSFFAFGLFAIARQSGLFPDQFFAIFDPVIDEEARHMVFFVNWVAYKQVHEGRGAKVLRDLNSLLYYTGSVRRRLDSFKGSKKGSGKGFTASGASSVTSNLTLEKFVSTCIQENDRRMSVYDSKLLRPEFLPRVAKTAFGMMKLLPKQNSSTMSSPNLG